MQSFTFGSEEGMQALREKQANEWSTVDYENRWSLTPNPTDFKTLIYALRSVSPGNDNAANLLCTIAESLGIEFV